MTERPCSTCKWMRDPGVWAFCVSPKIAETRPLKIVTGFETQQTSLLCGSVRIGTFANNSCGEEGFWWEPTEVGETAAA